MKGSTPYLAGGGRLPGEVQCAPAGLWVISSTLYLPEGGSELTHCTPPTGNFLEQLSWLAPDSVSACSQSYNRTEISDPQLSCAALSRTSKDEILCVRTKLERSNQAFHAHVWNERDLRCQSSDVAPGAPASGSPVCTRAKPQVSVARMRQGREHC